MPTQYGDNSEPGVISTESSGTVIATLGEAPNDAGIVGQADLSNAANAADPNTVYQIASAQTAINRFGPEDSSLLTQAVIGALDEDASPVYAAATESISVSAETHGSVTSTTFSLDNGPVREDPARLTVTLDGSQLSVNIVYDDVSTYSPDAGECYVNPVHARCEIPEAPGTSLEVSYDHFDYAAAHDAMVAEVGEVIDFLQPVSERKSVTDDAASTVHDVDNDYELAIACLGADIYLDPVDYTSDYDSNRVQTVYPTRFADGDTAMGHYVGKRASLALSTTPIASKLQTDRDLIVDLGEADRGTLIDKDVVPLANTPTGIEIVDDPTSNESGNIQYGFERLAMDYIIATTRLNEKPFIGRLNIRAVRNALESLIKNELTALEKSRIITDYTVNVLKGDATTARCEIEVDLSEPLRFVKNTYTIGSST